jgi:hypothetical protein
MYVIITEMFYKRLIQTTKHKCKFDDHFSKFLVTAETRSATHSARHVNRLFVSKYLGTFCDLSNFQHHSRPRRLYLRAAISICNYPTKLNTHTPIRISVCSPSHIPSLSLHPVSAYNVCLAVWTRYLRTVDSYCHTFETAPSLNMSISKSVYFALFYL